MISVETPTEEESITAEPPAPFAASPLAPEENLVIALPWPRLPRYPNVAYEGNNARLRPVSEDGTIDSGREVSMRWRRSAAEAGLVFVLRDSLFSQQDHPYRHRPWSPMLPPSWVSIAVDAARSGRELALPVAPDPGADGRWRRLRRREVFGSFPPSPSLLRQATRSLCDAEGAVERSWIANARRTLGVLARQAESLRAAALRGPEAAARAGAAAIADGDVRYFGETLRRTRIVPILVESPTEEEIREGKGFRPPSHPGLSDEAVRRSRRALLRRRLRDGDAAVERYDLADASRRRHARAVTREALRGSAAGGGRLWLWLSGPPPADGGTRAAATVASFRSEIVRDGIDPERVGFLYMPPIDDPHVARELARAARPIPLLARSGVAEEDLEERPGGETAGGRVTPRTAPPPPPSSRSRGGSAPRRATRSRA